MDENNELLDDIEETPEVIPDPIGTRIQSLKDINGDKVYPVTSAKAVYMPGKMTTVYEELTSYFEMGYITSFEGGNITTTYANKDVSVTEFQGGNIVETYKLYLGDDSEGFPQYRDKWIKTTSFEGGNIQTDIEYLGEGD